MGRRVGYCKSTISNIETKGYCPEGFLPKAAAELNRPEFRLINCFQCKDKFLKIPHLNLVDTNPVVMREKTFEEADEVVKAAQNLKLINKRSREDLKTEDVADVEKFLEELGDIMILGANLFVAYDRAYGVNLDKIWDRLTRKMIERGYYNPRKKEKAPALTGA